MALKVSTKANTRLKSVLDRINQDEELIQLWASANITAVDRLGMSDHGRVHIQIVANAAVKIFRLLKTAGILSSVESDHHLNADDAEVAIVLAACLHDVGMSIHRDHHETFSLIIGYPKARTLLEGIYQEPAITILATEAMHAVIAHQWDASSLSLEAGILKVADALDMTEGRSRIPFEAGSVNIHSLSAQAVEDVKIEPGQKKPVRINITLNNSAGIFQVDELLKRKLKGSTVAPYIEVIAHVEGEQERRLLEEYEI
ncbi:MAG: HD domain-containing protein [Anaerolineales bacterium]|nr:HD domain-containing protein [Anaerolineales bacterium]